MNVGFNQNVKHNGVVYHVQTEDGGHNHPVVTTVLFKEGVIVTSRRTDYADKLGSGEIEEVVGKIIRDQHMAVVNDLRSGCFEGEAWKGSQ